MLGENFQDPHERAGVAGHTGLGDGDDGEALLARDAGDEAAVVRVLLDALENGGAGVLRLVRVADVERDVLLTHGEDGALVEHLRADVAQLAQFTVGEMADGRGIVHDARVGHQNAGDVCPVFVDVGVQRRRCQRTGDVAAAAGEGTDAPVGHHAVEAGNDHAAVARGAAQRLVGRVGIHRAVEAELHPLGGVEELVAEVLGHQPRGEVFAARGQLVLFDALLHLRPQGVEVGIQVELQTAVVRDLEIARADHVENFLAAHAVFDVRGAEVQKVGDLVVAGKALAGRGHDDHAAGLVGLHDGLDLGELLGVGERRAAEFQNLKHFLYSSSILAKNAGSPQERARSARAKASATVMGPVQTVSLPVRR